MVGWSRCPVSEDGVAEGLNIKLAFPCEEEYYVPVCLVQDSNCTASDVHTLMARYFGDINQNPEDGDVISCGMVWE